MGTTTTAASGNRTTGDRSTEFAELIEKLERAEGPSASLDKEIAALCGISWSADEDGQFGGYGIMPRRVRFTESFDAALALVPKGRNWCVHTEPCGHSAYVVTVHCVEPHTDGPMQWDCSYHYGQQFAPGRDESSSAAIALCIAALKAREAVGGVDVS